MSTFTMQLDAAIAQKTELVSVVCRKTALEAFARIIMKTPVKTGMARNNWFCEIGRPSEQTSASADQSGAGSLARVNSVVGTWNPITGGIHLTNNLPYINRLEHGWSKQAPAGMVATTLSEFGSIVKESLQ